MAASVQKVTEDIMVKITKNLFEYKIPNLCLAGGVALNCLQMKNFKRKYLIIFIQLALVMLGVPEGKNGILVLKGNQRSMSQKIR